MASSPSIAVIIPARNEEFFVATAMRSVVDQEYAARSLECIVVDNGSIDGTAAATHTAAAEFPAGRVTVVHEPVPGVAAAKNRGATAASSTILLFLDADSRMSAQLARRVAESYAQCPVGSIRVLADGGNPIDRAFFRLMEVGKARFGIRAQMLYCDRGLFHRLGGFDVTLRLGEDVEFLKRAAAAIGRRPSHVSTAAIYTSGRRLARHHHLGTLTMFGRWLLAFAGIGRRRRY